MIKPPPLKTGDKIGIVATARRIRPEEIDKAVETFRQWGLEVVLSPFLFSEGHSYLAGNDEERIAGTQQFLDDPSVSAIFCARGGYGTTRIIDELTFKELEKKPKWIVGFSDLTAMHLKLISLSIQSIHGTMPILFSKKDAADSIESLRNALFGEAVELVASPSLHNRVGAGTGMVTGGNLSLLVDSLGTSHEVNTDGKILVLEELDEYLYKIDRMIVQLKRAGKLQSLTGLAVGHFSEIKDTELPFGESVAEIVLHHTRDWSYPVGFNFPTGHENPNHSWISGEIGLLEVTAHGAALKQVR